MALVFGAAQMVILFVVMILLLAVIFADPLSLVVAVGMVAVLSGFLLLPFRVRRRRAAHRR